jgi:hypothetical protein
MNRSIPFLILRLRHVGLLWMPTELVAKSPLSRFRRHRSGCWLATYHYSLAQPQSKVCRLDCGGVVVEPCYPEA